MLLAAIGILLVLMGVAIGWYGLRSVMVVPRIARAPIVEPSDGFDNASYVGCRGRVERDAEDVESPFTATTCVGCEFEVRERQPFGIGIPWFFAHLADGVATVPFRLTDGTTSIAVRPAGNRFTLDTESRVITVPGGSTPPERIQRFVGVHDGLSPVSPLLARIPGLGTRRYVERRIDPGGEYTVFGRTNDQEGERTLRGELVITDLSRRGLIARRVRSALFPVVVAAIFIVGGGWFLIA